MTFGDVFSSLRNKICLHLNNPFALGKQVEGTFTWTSWVTLDPCHWAGFDFVWLMGKFDLWGQGHFFYTYHHRPYLAHTFTQLHSGALWVFNSQRSWPLPTHTPPFLIFSNNPRLSWQRELDVKFAQALWVLAWWWGGYAQSRLTSLSGRDTHKHPDSAQIQSSQTLPFI